jgi:beta-glucosidase
VESGTYQVLVGSSSRDIRLKGEVAVQSTANQVEVPAYRDTASIYYNLPAGSLDIPLEQFEAIYGRKLPSGERDPRAPFTVNSTLGDARHTTVGKYLYNMFHKKMLEMLNSGEGMDQSMTRMIEAMLVDFPLRAFSMSGMPFAMIDGMVALLNKKYLKAVVKMVEARRAGQS